jgi:hypothetical protein
VRLTSALVLAVVLSAGFMTAAAAAGPDRTPPTTTALARLADGTAAAAWEARAVTVTLSATDNKKGALATYRAVDGGSFERYVAPVTFAAPADGSGDGLHTLSYYSVDRAGNREPTRELAVGIDTSAPETSLVVRALGATPSFAYAAVELSGAPAVALPYRYECRVTGTAAWSACPDGEKTYTGLADGGYQFAVRAVDAAGNVDATPATSQPWTSTAGAAQTVFEAAGTLTTDPGAGASGGLPNVASVIVGDAGPNQQTRVGIGLDAPRAGDCAATYKCFSPQTYVVSISELVAVSGTPVYREQLRVDRSVVPANLSLARAMVFHDGNNVPNCNTPFPQAPSPGPMCVISRSVVADGDWQFVLITTENGRIRM